MGIVGGSTLYGMVRNFRVVWISGRFGGGKTALAYQLAGDLCDRYGYRYIFSNLRSVWDDDWRAATLRDGHYVDGVVILDEGGLFLKTSHDAEAFLAYLRKLNLVILVPSVQPPSTRLRFVTIQRMMDLYSVGLPAWLYRLDLEVGRVKEKDTFWWWRPRDLFGIYDTLAAPEDDGGLNDAMGVWVNALREKTGSRRRVSVVPDLVSGSTVNGSAVGSSGLEQTAVLDQISRLVATVADSADEMGRVSTALSESVSKPRHRRKR